MGVLLCMMAEGREESLTDSIGILLLTRAPRFILLQVLANAVGADAAIRAFVIA
jgi:hypothetical protein